jgi:SNF2 family DNA or RNA helicase
MTQKEWRKITDNVNTRELTKFSVWQQPDDEYYDDSDVIIEKFFIKWIHASYLHCSWETETDLMEMVGPTAKQYIKKFRLRAIEGTELFEDLSKGEYFPQSFLIIERVLDIDDPDCPILSVDWENAPLPPSAIQSAEDALVVNKHAVNECVDDIITSENDYYFSDFNDKKRALEEESKEYDEVKPLKKPNKRKKISKKAQLNYLHGDNVWLTIKWEGLAYSEVSFESLTDILARGIEYEQQMRNFVRREQKQLVKQSKKDSFNAKRTLNDSSIIGTTPPLFNNGSILKDFQWEGVRWMLFNLLQNRNCILADEMGLGKTIQSAALLQMLKNCQHSSTITSTSTALASSSSSSTPCHVGPFLIIAPLSTIVNWQREINTWTNLDCILYYGSQEDRDLIRSYEFKFLDKNINGYKIEIIITTPETCVTVDDKTSTNRIRRELSSIDWDLIIVDEAHKLKNYDSKLASTLREEYSFKNCILLTGTPLQNNTEELWNLLNFIAKDDFHDRDEFIQDFGELKTSIQLEQLHKRIKPYLLRREKEFVEKTVPPKEEIVIEVELTVPQKQYYRAIYEQKTGFLYKQGQKDGPSLSNLAMELRKCCNHPFLIKGAALELSKHFINDSQIDILVKTSGKMTLLAKLLPKLFADGHRVLIFSQFRMMLDIIEDYISTLSYQYERIDGSITGKKRQNAIDRFSTNNDVFLMLLSTRAGGVGINLTAADTVIIFDSDWNPQNDIQAQARAHRIGQTKPVTVYRLLTKKTYEMVMFRAASIKLGLDYAVMHNLKGSVEVTLPDASSASSTGKGSRSKSKNSASVLAGISVERAEHVSSLSKKELENLLKHGAYDMFLEEKEGVSETESKLFIESSIEDILQNSSTFLHKENDSNIECTKTGSSVTAATGSNSSSFSFAKASFISAGSTSTENEVAIDDPDFWDKVVGLSVEDQEILAGGKRKCRNNVDNYKEPSDSIRSIYSNYKDAYITDSDNEGDDPAGKEKRKKRRKDEIVPAVFSADNIMSILSAVVGYGYGNWKEVRKASKMYWIDEELAKGARYGLLYLLLASSIQVDSSLSSTPSAPNASEAVSSSGKCSSDSSTENEMDGQNNDDDKEEIKNVTEMEGVLETVPTLATSVSSEDVTAVVQPLSETPIVVVSRVDPATYKYEAKSFIATVNRYRGVKLALSLYLNTKEVAGAEVLSCKLENEVLINFKSFFESKVASVDPSEFVEITPLFIKESYCSFLELDSLLKGDDVEVKVEQLIRDLLNDDLMKSLICHENELSKAQKKAANKAKFSQIEDLFESQLYSLLSLPLSSPPTARAAVAEPVVMEVENDNVETPSTCVEPSLTEKFAGNLEFLKVELEKVPLPSNDAPEWWNYRCDCFTLCKVAQVSVINLTFPSFIHTFFHSLDGLTVKSVLPTCWKLSNKIRNF